MVAFENLDIYASGLIFVFGCGLMIVFSLVTSPADAARLDRTVWSKRIWLSDRQALRGIPWYRNWMVLSFLLLAITAVIVVWWW